MEYIVSQHDKEIGIIRAPNRDSAIRTADLDYPNWTHISK